MISFPPIRYGQTVVRKAPSAAVVEIQTTWIELINRHSIQDLCYLKLPPYYRLMISDASLKFQTHSHSLWQMSMIVLLKTVRSAAASCAFDKLLLK